MGTMVVMAEHNKRSKGRRNYRANGEALSDFRDQAHLTLEDLEAASGVSYTTISRIENGRIISPRWSTLKQIANALGVEVDALVIYRTGSAGPKLPGGARTEEHLDAVLDHEAEVRERQKAGETEGEGNGPGGGRT